MHSFAMYLENLEQLTILNRYDGVTYIAKQMEYDRTFKGLNIVLNKLKKSATVAWLQLNARS